MPHLYSKKIPSKLNFSPNFPNDMVEVTLGTYDLNYPINHLPKIAKRKANIFYVVVRGDDDISVQTEAITYQTALSIYNGLIAINSDQDLLVFKDSPQCNGWPH